MATQFPSAKLLDEGAVALGTLDSATIDFKLSASAAFYAKWTKTVVTGTIIAQWSANGEDWVDIGTAGDLNADSVYTVLEENRGYHYLRLRVVVATGSLTSLEAWYNGKG